MRLHLMYLFIVELYHQVPEFDIHESIWPQTSSKSLPIRKFVLVYGLVDLLV